MNDLIETLKAQIIEQLNLAELKPEDIDPNAPLFGDGLGLDSIDALELIEAVGFLHHCVNAACEVGV